MKIITTIAEFRDERKRMGGRSLGFVPTMGFLHDGHLSLVKASKSENDITAVSIFVNPAQFGPNEDLDRYPRDLERDKKMLEELDVDILFFPPLEAVYPEGFATYVEVESVSRLLCGKSRPGHFRGVATIVLKLFNMVTPDRAYFGRKDAQQAVTIKKMVTDLNLDVAIRTVPIVRDPDGLALSSRNWYLTKQERESALCLSRALKRAKNAIADGCLVPAEIKEILHEEINNTEEQDPSVKLDYLEIVRLDNLQPCNVIDTKNTLVAGAIYIGKTRLIDNFILGEI